VQSHDDSAIVSQLDYILSDLEDIFDEGHTLKGLLTSFSSGFDLGGQINKLDALRSRTFALGVEIFQPGQDIEGKQEVPVEMYFLNVYLAVLSLLEWARNTIRYEEGSFEGGGRPNTRSYLQANRAARRIRAELNIPG